METPADFSTKQAFSRSLGWLTEGELKKLSLAHVGIIGMGGVGGQYAEVLARLGIGRFTLCDPDSFSIENTNRQNECKVSNYGRNKADVIAELIRDINPEAHVTVLPGAMNSSQVPSFCASVDIYLDALDFYEIDLRLEIFRKMYELGKPAVTSGPIGMGAASLVFKPGSMTFDDYFGLHTTKDVAERSQLFLLGLAPSLQQRHYLQERNRVDLAKRITPSLPIGVYACATVVATAVTKIVLDRGKILAAPWSVHYDAYQMKIAKKYIWLGYRNPIQRLKLLILRRMLQKRPDRT